MSLSPSFIHRISTTDARYIYRCLDTALKQIQKLGATLDEAPRLSKTLLTRCYSLSQSITRKIVRCSPFLDTDPSFMSVSQVASNLTSCLHSHLIFPVRFTTSDNRFIRSLTEMSDSVRRTLAEILNGLGEVLAKLEQPKAKVSSPTPTPRPDNIFVQFLSQAKERGWTVREPQQDEESTDPQDDPFYANCALIRGLTQPYTTLLDEETDAGIISMSIILMEAYKLPETVLSTCEENCPIHRVFGTYTVLQEVPVMGVRRDLLQTVTEGKTTLDPFRFRSLLPYVKRNHPEYELSKAFPSGPARFARYHYYTPLLPISLTKNSDFHLGNWNFLVSRKLNGQSNVVKQNETEEDIKTSPRRNIFSLDDEDQQRMV